MILQVPWEALEFAGMSINFRSGKFGYSICPIFSKVMLKFTENFSITFAENRTYGVPVFAGTEVNRHSGKLKGLSGYLQHHHKYHLICTSLYYMMYWRTWAKKINRNIFLTLKVLLLLHCLNFTSFTSSETWNMQMLERLMNQQMP